MAAFVHEVWGADDIGVRTVLDVCCGTGLMASELIALGHRVTGIDASAAMLARARRLLGPDVGPGPGNAAGPHDRRASSTPRCPRFDGLNYLTLTGVEGDPGGPGGSAPSRWLARLRRAHGRADGVHRGQPGGRGRGGRMALRDHERRGRPRLHVRFAIEVTCNSDGDALHRAHRQHSSPTGRSGTRSASPASRSSRSPTSTRHEPADGSTLRATWTARATGVPDEVLAWPRS